MASTYGGSENTGTGMSVRLINSMKQKTDALLSFLYDSDKGRVMGRTGISWGKIGLFYLIYYTCLAAFFVMTMAIFNQTLDQDYPKLQGSDSLLKDNPGLGFRPLPDVGTTLIRFVKGRPSTYKPYTNNLETFLKYYENSAQNGENFMECQKTSSFRPKNTWDKVCKFDLSYELGENPCIKQDDFGYDDGMPCILLKLNRIYGWMPRPYDNVTDEHKPPPELKDFDPNFVKVQCEGEYLADKDNLRGVTFYPPNGFHVKFFPYLNQMGYRQPLVFAQFEVTNGVVVMVHCKAYAKNIRLNKRELAGSVHFEILVD